MTEESISEHELAGGGRNEGQTAYINNVTAQFHGCIDVGHHCVDIGVPPCDGWEDTYPGGFMMCNHRGG